MYCDLHTHSHYSDGSCSPSQLIALAKQSNRIVALTDHNTVAGLPEFMTEAKKWGVTAVGGVELSTEYEGQELHLLGLFVPESHYRTVEDWTQEYCNRKEQSNQETVKRLQEDGYAISYSDLIRQNGRYINRVHIAGALCKAGYVQTISQAFDALLKEEHGYYQPPVRPSFFDALAFLLEIKSVPVIAHPLKDLKENTLHSLLSAAVSKGLVGMEVFHSSYSENQSKTAAEIAKAYALLPSGGSDFHGCRKPNTPFGIPEIPRQVYDDLLQFKNSAF